jgi:hypothetical protein
MSRPQALREISSAFTCAALMKMHADGFCPSRNHAYCMQYRKDAKSLMSHLGRALRELRPAQKKGMAV